MNIAIILASGNGSRIKQSKIPKQFIKINNKPIVIHTLERFIYNKNIDKTIIICHPKWIDYLSNYINKHYSNDNIFIVEGGKERNDSIANAIRFLDKKLNVKDDDVILTHDAVRMFVSDRIIIENIEMCKKYGAVTTAVPTIDTIGIIKNNKIVDVPNRNDLVNIQTPQTFLFNILKYLYLHNKIKNSSDICKSLFDKKLKHINIVYGEYENFKITTNFDLYLIKNKRG